MIYPLHPQVQHYDWGGFEFLPQLLGLPAPQQKPFAELWMGTHAAAPTSVEENGATVLLSDWIAADPERRLGPEVARRFAGQLPFLFKLLDVRKMLSIQAHPTKEKAEAGFRRENELGIPLTAPNRVYKDDNHKPEIMVALSEFWLLHGFRSPEAIRAEMERVPELGPLQAYFPGDDIAALYRTIMEWPQQTVDELLAPLRERLLPLSDAGALPKASPDYWAALAFRDFELPGGHTDRGIFSIYLLHLLCLHPGEGIYQAAGIPHAYLEGQNVELMANSDNVFRGGLTPKYIAVEELLDNLSFAPVQPRILTGVLASAAETIYPTHSPDFELSRIHLHNGERYVCAQVSGPEMLIVLQGAARTDAGRAFGKGQTAYAQPGEGYALTSVGETVIFKATVGSE
jgi:mannose-6-phosphate isomerase